MAGKSPGHTHRTITIEGKEIPVIYEELQLDRVLLDPDNPRIRESVKQKQKNGKIAPEELHNIIWQLPAVPELFKSIRDNKGLLEPIYVRSDGRVAEGNCRTVIYHRLKKTFPQEERWKRIPALRLPADVTDREVAVLQGMFHVAGKITWRAHEQSGHLHFMRTTLKMTPKDIARALGMQERVVAQLLDSYDVSVTKLFPLIKKRKEEEAKKKAEDSKGGKSAKEKPEKGGEELKKHSYVLEFHKNRKLKDFREKKPNVDRFVKWVAEGKLKQGREVRDLYKIVAHPKALEALDREGYEEAMKVLRKTDPTAGSPTFGHLLRATETLNTMSAQDLERVKTGPKEQQLLKNLFEALKSVASTAKINLR